MEDKKIVTVNTEEVAEVSAESKKTGIIKKVGSGIKKNWKSVVAGVLGFGLGVALTKRNSASADSDEAEDDDYVTVNDDESES